MVTTEKKIKIRIFVSYAHADDEYADSFMKGFREMLSPSKKYSFEFWQDKAILPGETWANEICNALEKCNLGVMLVSPSFLGSEFITQEELPKFIGETSTSVVPIMLRKVNLKLHDLKGLGEKQIFRLKAGPDNYKSYAQCGKSQRNDFVYDLHEQVESRLDKIYA